MASTIKMSKFINKTYFETVKVRNVEERHLLDVELELSLVGNLTEWAIRVSLDVSNLEFSTVTLSLILLSMT